MRSGILILLIIGLLPVASGGAESYSCRDRQGRLFFADSPLSLPDECQGKTKKIESGKEDNLNFVPAVPMPSGSGKEFKRSVTAVELQQQYHQQQIQQLKLKAEQLAKSYQDAVEAKRSALRRWSYTSRDKIKQADQQMAQARVGKQQLLQELGSLRMSSADEQKVKQTLGLIGAE